MRYLTLIIAALSLTACASVFGAVDRGFEFTTERIDDYCLNTPQMERQLLRDRVAYPDGSPRVVVFCAPGGTFTEAP